MKDKKVVIVDDDRAIVKALQMTLRAGGFLAEPLERFDDVENDILKAKPDIVLLDVMLGSKDGLEIARNLRARKRLDKMPIILISANNISKDEVKRSRADAFIPKPFSSEALLKTLRDLGRA